MIPELVANTPIGLGTRCIGMRMMFEGIDFPVVAAVEYAALRKHLDTFKLTFINYVTLPQKTVDAEAARYWTSRMEALYAHFTN